MMKLRLLISLVAIFPLFCFAANEDKPIRPVCSAYMADFGGASLLDTYLTPIRYNGWHVRLGYERSQSMCFNPHNWIMQMAFGVRYDNVQNLVKNRTMHALMLDFSWGMMHKWRNVCVPKLNFFAGASTSFDGGVIYNQYNSNNPVSAKIRWSLNLTGMVTYGLKIVKLPITLRYQATVPFVGLFFSPGYGESFYEIYVGNTSGLVHFGAWHNRFDMTNLLTADLHLGATCLRLGYRGTIESSWINHINTQIFTHSAVVGVSGEWISLNPHKSISREAEIISSYY